MIINYWLLFFGCPIKRTELQRASSDFGCNFKSPYGVWPRLQFQEAFIGDWMRKPCRLWNKAAQAWAIEQTDEEWRTNIFP
jgi:hypothetical protein